MPVCGTVAKIARSFVFITTIIGFIASCRQVEQADRPMVEHSAGIRIVQHPGQLCDGGQYWNVSARPYVVIGISMGEPAYELHRVVGAVRLSDGRIVIANAGSGELRFYDSAGRYLARAGGLGDGPTEFRSLQWLRRYSADTLVAYDGRFRRISVFDPQGRLVRAVTLRLPEDLASYQILGPTSDGSWIALRRWLPGLEEVPEGFRRDSVLYLRLGAGGYLIDTIGVFPGDETYRVVIDEDERAILDAIPPFGRRTFAAVRGHQLLVAANDSYTIRVFGVDGQLREIIRKLTPNPRVSTDDIRRYREAYLESGLDSWRPHRERVLAETEFPETMPAYGGVELDVEGNLWVADYRVPGSTPWRWTVFDRIGRCVAMVETPSQLALLEIGSDYLLGLERDELEVQRVALYRLQKRQALP